MMKTPDYIGMQYIDTDRINDSGKEYIAMDIYSISL